MPVKRKIYTGSRGGKYYISKGCKVYVEKSKQRPGVKKVKPTLKKVKPTVKRSRVKMKSATPAKIGYFTITTRYEDGKRATRTFSKAFMDRKGLTSSALNKAMSKGDSDVMDSIVELQIQEFSRPDPVSMTIKKNGKSKTVSF